MYVGIMNFLASWWVSYVVFGVTAALGGILAVHNPPKEATAVRWSYGLTFVVLFLLGLAVSKAQHDDSIKQAGNAAAAASRDVRDAIARATREAVAPYQAKIDRQEAQIDQLTRESRKVSNSDFVTGKTPVKVEVTNGTNVPTGPTQAGGFRYFSSLQASGSKEVPYFLQVSIQPDGTISPIIFEVECSGAITRGEAGVMGYGIVQTQTSINRDRFFRFFIESPSVATPSQSIIVTLLSAKPIRVVNVQRLSVF